MALHARSAALAAALLLLADVANAQEPAEPQPQPEPQKSDAPEHDPLEKFPPPPAQPRPVPDPSPVVVGVHATPDDITAKPLVWKRARFSTADYVITGAGAALTLGRRRPWEMGGSSSRRAELPFGAAHELEAAAAAMGELVEWRATTSSEVVVVLPLAPATATPRDPTIVAASP